jgi:hypothetical protein
VSTPGVWHPAPELGQFHLAKELPADPSIIQRPMRSATAGSNSSTVWAQRHRLAAQAHHKASQVVTHCHRQSLRGGGDSDCWAWWRKTHWRWDDERLALGEGIWRSAIGFG